MATAVEQDGPSVVVSSCTFFDEAGICLLKNLAIFWHFGFSRLDMMWNIVERGAKHHKTKTKKQSNMFNQEWKYVDKRYS
jgi:hypothetical protein